jgi:hypothetical protein
MKKTLLTILICFNTIFCFSQPFPKKQTLIPLSNVNGVPFYKDEELNDIGINGFEIDDKGNFYFLSGDKLACLSAYAGNEQLYRKTYKDFAAGQLHIYKTNLYTFDRLSNDIVVLNLSNGSVTKKYKQITSEDVNSYFFADSSLIVEVASLGNSTYKQYSLSGKYIKLAHSAYNQTPFVTNQAEGRSEAEFLGEWNGNLIFWDLVIGKNDSQSQKFWLVNPDSKILATKSIINKADMFGNIYAENPEEHRKVRNGNLYVLGRKGNNALITVVPLASFFGKQ